MRRAFTLIEILISVSLLSLIVLFVTSTIYQTKNNNNIFKYQVEEVTKDEIYLDTLYTDLLQSDDIHIQNYKNYSIVSLRSGNSVYGISHPFVVWLVLKHEKTLIRLESAKELTLPIDADLQPFVYMDLVKKSCKYFQVSLSKDKKSILVFIKTKNSKTHIFEVKRLNV